MRVCRKRTKKATAATTTAAATAAEVLSVLVSSRGGALHCSTRHTTVPCLGVTFYLARMTTRSPLSHHPVRHPRVEPWSYYDAPSFSRVPPSPSYAPRHRQTHGPTRANVHSRTAHRPSRATPRPRALQQAGQQQQPRLLLARATAPLWRALLQRCLYKRCKHVASRPLQRLARQQPARGGWRGRGRACASGQRHRDVDVFYNLHLQHL